MKFVFRTAWVEIFSTKSRFRLDGLCLAFVIYTSNGLAGDLPMIFSRCSRSPWRLPALRGMRGCLITWGVAGWVWFGWGGEGGEVVLGEKDGVEAREDVATVVFEGFGEDFYEGVVVEFDENGFVIGGDWGDWMGRCGCMGDIRCVARVCTRCRCDLH